MSLIAAILEAQIKKRIEAQSEIESLKDTIREMGESLRSTSMALEVATTELESLRVRAEQEKEAHTITLKKLADALQRKGEE